MKIFQSIPLRGIMTLFLCLLLLSACEKDELSLTPATTNQLTLSHDLATSFRIFDENLEDNLMYPEEPEMEKINQLSYHLGQATRNVITNNEYLELIMTGIKANNYHQVNILTLATENPQLLQVINEELRKSFATAKYDFQISESDLNNKDWNVLAFIDSKMTYNSDKYIPVIYTAKSPVENSVLPLVAVGQQVNEADDIAAWNGDDVVLISEQEATDYSGNILFVSHGMELSDNSNGSALNNSNAKIKNVALREYKIKGCQYRYENSGKSDVRAFFFSTSTFSDVHGTVSWGLSKKSVCRQKNRGVNYGLFAVPDIEFNNSPHIIGFFERDWYASHKYADGYSTCNSLYTIPVRMTYQNEYYYQACGQTLSSFWSGSSDEAIFENYKSRFKIKKF